MAIYLSVEVNRIILDSMEETIVFITLCMRHTITKNKLFENYALPYEFTVRLDEASKSKQRALQPEESTLIVMFQKA